MTVISEPVSTIAGADNNTTFEFASPYVRASVDGLGLITVRPIQLTATDGILTTPPLDPGIARVRIGTKVFYVEIPDWPDNDPIQLTPLLDAAAPILPSEEEHAVRNGGGVRRLQVVTESEYAALSPPDPETEYSVIPDE